jgi:hypothetical protein
VYPSDWIEDHFMTVDWQADLRGKTLMTLKHPSQRVSDNGSPIYDNIFGMAESAEAQRVAGSLFGSMQHVPGSMAPNRPLAPTSSPLGWACGPGPFPVCPPCLG